MDDNNRDVATEFKPGETIRPSGPTELPPVVQTSAPTAIQPESVPQQLPPQQPLFPPLPQPVQVQAPGLISTDPMQSTEPEMYSDGSQITWTASEFIDHSKSADWYLALAVVAVLSAAALYFLFRDLITAVTPLVAALALGFYGRRKPRQLQYQINSSGLTIAGKNFAYEKFRSFAIMDEGPFASLVFLPLKRFGMLTTVYLDPQDEERIVDLVADYLPLEPRNHDAVDRLMKRIRF